MKNYKIYIIIIIITISIFFILNKIYNTNSSKEKISITENAPINLSKNKEDFFNMSEKFEGDFKIINNVIHFEGTDSKNEFFNLKPLLLYLEPDNPLLKINNGHYELTIDKNFSFILFLYLPNNAILYSAEAENLFYSPLYDNFKNKQKKLFNEEFNKILSLIFNNEINSKKELFDKNFMAMGIFTRSYYPHSQDSLLYSKTDTTIHFDKKSNSKRNFFVSDVTYYYKNGNIEQNIRFKNDKKEGKAKIFYENGNLDDISYFKNDKLEGETKFFDKYGNLIETHFYKNGKLIGGY